MLITGFFSGTLHALAFTPSDADFNQDGCINKNDVDYFADNFDANPINTALDLNGDNKVSIRDFAYVTANYSASCTPGSLPSDPDGYYTLHITYQGIQRQYVIFVPSSYKPSVAAPVVVHLHASDTAPDAEMRLSLMASYSSARGYVVILPEAVNGVWNDGRGFAKIASGNADDVGFIDAVIADLASQMNLNQQKMYVTGMSNGGIMTYRLACERPNKFKAFAPVSGGLASELTCNPSTTAPLVIFQGVADPILPYNGGTVSPNRGNVLATESVALSFATKNNCNTTPIKTNLPDVDTTDGTTVTKWVYSGCRNGANVELYQIHGGGHTWPGGIQYDLESVIGKTSRDVSATPLMWTFFTQF